MKALLVELLPVVLPLLLTGLTAGTAWVALHLGAWLKAKAQGSRAFAALAVLDDLVFSVVQDIEATEKAAILSRLGTGAPLTAQDALSLKTLALSRLKAVLGTEGLAALQKAIGAVFGGDVNTLLSGKVETAVTRVAAGPVLAASASALSARVLPR